MPRTDADLARLIPSLTHSRSVPTCKLRFFIEGRRDDVGFYAVFRNGYYQLCTGTLLLICDNARESLADASTRFVQFLEMLVSMEGKTDVSEWFGRKNHALTRDSSQI